MNKKFFMGCICLTTILAVMVVGCLSSKAPFLNHFSLSSIKLKNVQNKNNIIPIAIIGSGPAGLGAAIYAARSGKSTIVIEGDKPGGLLTETTDVENYPGYDSILGPELIKNMKMQAHHQGAQFLQDTIERVDFSQWPFALYTQDGNTLHALSIIIATGATPRRLQVPGEETYWGAGVTACAICDAPFFKNEDVVVVGGGDSAVEEAIQLAPYASNITILVRKDRMRATSSMQERLKGYSNIDVVYNVEVQKIVGDDTKVTGVELLNNKTNTTSIMPISGVFLAIGHDPNTEIFRDIVQTDAQGYIIVHNRSQETSVPGVFAAGDVEDHEFRQAGVAQGSGIKAALEADKFLGSIGFTQQFANKIKNKLFTIDQKRRVYGTQKITNLNDFQQCIEQNELVIVDFYADYCPSCMQMVPVFESIAQEFGSHVTFAKIDADEATDVVKKHFVHKVPCLLVFRDGNLLARYSNTMNKKELRLFVEQFLSSH